MAPSTRAGRETAKQWGRSVFRTLYTRPNRALYVRGTLSTDRLTLPRFLGIGAPKAGTTWLHHNMAAHPDLYLPEIKELHFFNVRTWLTMGWYSRQFTAAGHRVPGEITPGYAALPEGTVRQIATLIPEVRLLYLVRDPIERMWSHAVMKLARERDRAVGDVTDAEFLAHFEEEHATGRGDYVGAVDRWQKAFSPEQLWVGSFDDIKERPRDLLTEVFEHVGVRTDVRWEDFPAEKVIDRGVHRADDVFDKKPRQHVPDRFVAPLNELLAPQIEAFAERYPDIGKRWVR